jgi:hypothetical protein
MKEYKVKSSDPKHFSLTMNDKKIGTLIYEKWFSFKAKMALLETKHFQIEPKGFWGTTIELIQDGKVLLNFKMNWNGNIIVHTRFDEAEKDFIFKQKGLLKTSYVLLNKEEEELLVIQPDFKWSKFNYDYNISTSDSFDALAFSEILVLTAIHCVNYYMTMVTSIASI